MGHVIPYQVVLMLVAFLLLSRRYPPALCLTLFSITFIISILGLDSLNFILVVIGVYSLGYLFRLLLCNEASYDVTNFSFGIVILFFPLFCLSVISNITDAFSFSLLASTKIAINICILLLIASSVVFIYREHAKLVIFFKVLKESNKINNLSFFLVALMLSLFSYVAVPVINYDDLGTHYYLQNQFSLGNYPSFDVSTHVWAVSQWVFDIYYGFFESLFEGLGRATLNLLLAFTIVASVFSLVYKRLGFNVALLVSLLSISSPIFTLSLTTSQTELISVFLLVNILYLALNYKNNSLLLSLPLFALSVGIKPSNAVIFIFPLFVFAYLEFKEYRFINIKKKKFILTLVFSSFIAFGIYIFAYLKTGNPFFPLFNSIFKAEHFPHTDFFNSLYSGNFKLEAFHGLIFNTSKYLESNNGVIGYQLIFLPIFLLSLPFVFRHNIKSTMLLLSMVVGGLCIFYSQQYGRYIMPVLFVVPVLYVIIISSILEEKKKLKSVVLALISIIIFFNLYKTPKVIWYLNGWNNQDSFSDVDRREKRNSYDRIFEVNTFLNTLSGKVKVLYPYDKPYASNLDGEYVYVNWYNTAAAKAYNGSKTALLSYLQEQGVTHLVLAGNTNETLKSIASQYGSLIYQNFNYDVYKLDILLSDYTSHKRIKVGNPIVLSDDSFIVTSEDFYVFEYDKIVNKDKLKITIELSCQSGGVWKDYIEYNRNTNFSNLFRIIECPATDSVFKHEVVIKLPNKTDNISIFLQPISGSFKVHSIKLQDL